MTGASFDGTKTHLRSLLGRADSGKSITREPELFRAGVVAEAYDEGPEEWDVEEPIEEAAQ
jgi:hypothetical protein